MATIHRAEVIGSLLRPEYLKQARGEWQAGRMPTHEFKQVEDRAVGEAIALQEASGVDVVTDGEVRRVLFTGSLTHDWQMPFSVTGRIALRRSLPRRSSRSLALRRPSRSRRRCLAR